MARMTINQLHAITAKLIEQGQGRRYLGVAKGTFNNPLEQDGDMVLDVGCAELEFVPLWDEDGGGSYRKDGTERGSEMLVLYGTDRARLTRKNSRSFRESGSKEGGWCANCGCRAEVHVGPQRRCKQSVRAE